MSERIELLGYDFIEFYVGSAKMAAYWYAKALGFSCIAYQGPESGSRDRCSYVMKSGDITVVLTSALQPSCYDIQSFVSRHGDGVKRFAYRVGNVEKAYALALSRGAIPVSPPSTLKDEAGQVHSAAIRIYDDTEIVLVDRSTYKGPFQPGFITPRLDMQVDAHPTGLVAVDHIVGNVYTNQMDVWAKYFETVFDFETFIHFGPGDISTKYSALLSKVVRSPGNVIRNPINEPFEGLKKSQIEEYLQEYHGSGIQHIALETKDIISTIRALRHNGVEFLSVPKSYYAMLREEKRVKIRQNIDDLEALGILCDTKDKAGGDGYLLQLFTKPIGDRPTFFFEIIQRVDGSQGFGQGNFQSLFESIEREQALRGNL